MLLEPARQAREIKRPVRPPARVGAINAALPVLRPSTISAINTGMQMLTIIRINKTMNTAPPPAEAR